MFVGSFVVIIGVVVFVFNWLLVEVVSNVFDLVGIFGKIKRKIKFYYFGFSVVIIDVILNIR